MQSSATGNRNLIIALLVATLAAFGLGRCSSEPKQGEIKAEAIGTTINQLKELDRLVVFRTYVTAVTTARDPGVIFDSTQAMISPAYVNYYVDLGQMDASSVTYGDNTLRVKLPPLMIERANIDARGVRIFNDGVLTNATAVHEKLRKANNRIVYRQLRNAASNPTLVRLARQQAALVTLHHVQRILDATGQPSPAIRVSF